MGKQRAKMKYFIVILLHIPLLAFSQEQWEIDMIEEESKQHFDTGIQIYNVAQNIIEFDYQLEQLDTSTQKGKLKHEVLSEQRHQVLTYALWEFERILDYYPSSTIVNQAIFNKAQIHYELRQIDSARTYYLILVEKEIPSELDTSRIRNKNDERYFNFKNSAYKRLSNLEYNQGNYQKSIDYLDKSIEIGFNHFSGTSQILEARNVAISYAKSYYKLDRIDAAIDYLLPYILTNSITRRTDKVANLALEYMLTKYEREYLLKEYEKGFKEYYKKQRTNSKWIDYYFKFLDKEIEINVYEPDNIDEEERVVIETLKGETFYKLLKGEKPTHNTLR